MGTAVAPMARMPNSGDCAGQFGPPLDDVSPRSVKVNTHPMAGAGGLVGTGRGRRGRTVGAPRAVSRRDAARHYLWRTVAASWARRPPVGTGHYPPPEAANMDRIDRRRNWQPDRQIPAQKYCRDADRNHAPMCSTSSYPRRCLTNGND